MGILLASAPFIAFAVLDRLFGTAGGLAAAAPFSAVLLCRDWLGATRSPKILEIGTFVLFGSLAAYAVPGSPQWWSVMGVRLCVDAGSLLIVLLHMPQIPLRVGILITAAAIVGAVKFTSWYPKRHAVLAV